MNDPHVIALYYRVCHNKTVDYSRARTTVIDEDLFVVKIEDGAVRFGLRSFCATEAEARTIVDPFIRNWEFDAGLQHAPGDFRLEFDRSEIVDRQPQASEVRASASPIRFHFGLSSPTATVFRVRYPSPPSGIDSDHPDVQTLYQRYKGFREGKELLPSFAYFCLTAIEHSVGPGGGNRERAACQYCIDEQLLRKIGCWSSTKGGKEARKERGLESPLTAEQRRFLERSIVTLIRRVAEYHSRNGNLPRITVKEINRSPN